MIHFTQQKLWRELENKIDGQSHTVYHLAVHLPEEKQMYDQKGQREQEKQAKQSITHSTAWFKF